METLDHANFSCLAPFSIYHLVLREKPPDSGNRTRCTGAYLLREAGLETLNIFSNTAMQNCSANIEPGIGIMWKLSFFRLKLFSLPNFKEIY